MLKIQLSNRIENLCAGVVEAMGTAPTSPFTAQQIVVPSSAMRRHLTLAIAERHGICANVECAYLAQWLWSQIARVVRTVTVESPFAASSLEWCLYRLLQESAWTDHPRLARYLADADDVLRFELASAVASLFEQYITYRQDWMSTWLRGGAVAMPHASAAQVEDQAWQAELWRRIGGDLGAAPEHPAMLFLRRLAAADPLPFDLPEAVHVFCLPAIPPLYLAVLTGMAHWMDVTLYVLDPCREYWFDIVDPTRLQTLALRGAVAHHETGNRLLASWGKQTKAFIELLLDGAADAPLEDAGFDEEFPASRLGALQRSIYTLTELAPASLSLDAGDRSIEVHVCHSLTRELEVLQDQLLAVFAGDAPPRPQDILIVTPDLESAAPLIDAVFGNAPDDRRLPYAITGRRRSAVNAAARALMGLLAIVSSRFAASALVELLQQPLVARRFGIGTDDLAIIEEWLHVSGIRWGLDAEQRRELGVPGDERFTVADGLDRLFLGYALPQHVGEPAFGRIPAGNAEGSRAGVLGCFAQFVERLTRLRADLAASRLPELWLATLLQVLETFLAPAGEEVEEIAEVRDTVRELHADMVRGRLVAPVPLSVVRAGLEARFDASARGGVPTGAITFASMSSLRNLPFRFVGIIGLDDGAFPAVGRPLEFDLMAAAPRAGDRQRRLDDRNLFLDLVLAARERLYLSYGGRSIRDDSVRPPSVVVAELLDTLLPALAPTPGDAAALARARSRLIVEHPLQAFAESNFRDADPRRRSFNRELCDALRHRLSGERAAVYHDETEVFFAAPLAAPGPEWQHVSLAQLQWFFRNPCDYLLRHRLGMSSYRAEDGVVDEEPFLPDFHARRALAERLLPQAMQGVDAAQLGRLARAGTEYPPGALGSAALAEEMALLQRFARDVRDATRAPLLPPLAIDLPFVLDGEDWRLQTLLTERRETGLVLHRYADIRPGDYVAAWLAHLVQLAAEGIPAPPAETRWISRDGWFRFGPYEHAHALLERLLALYRRGLRTPLHFFPKSAWEYIRSNRNLGTAHDTWHPTYANASGEDRHAAYRLALRGVAEPLDDDFRDCAETVFGPLAACLDEPRP